MSRLKRRNFRIFPGRLPQSWMQVSHGAQGFAFHWWRVFEDEAVALPVDCLAPSLGLHSKARRYVAEWLAELIASRAIERLADGSLRMLLAVQSERQADVETTPSERPVNGERTVNERSSDGERTLPQRSSRPKLPESIGGRAPENAQTDRQTDETDRSAREGAQKPHPSRLIPLLDHETRAEAFKRGIKPSPSVFGEQARKAAERAQELLDDGTCPDAQEAVQALVRAAFDHVAAHKGSRYAFALLECAVAAKPEPFRTYIQPRGSV